MISQLLILVASFGITISILNVFVYKGLICYVNIEVVDYVHLVKDYF